LQPAQVDRSSTILAFYRAGQRESFSLYQSHDGLALQAELKSALRKYNPAKLAFLPGIFRRCNPLFIAITSGPAGTAVYLDGGPPQRFPGFRPSAPAFTGRLVLANSPLQSDSWSGIWHGLAIYDRELTPAQVRRHYTSWTSRGRPDLHDDEQASAVFLFDRPAPEDARVIPNQVPSGVSLQIPKTYSILDEKFLEPPWSEFARRWSYAKDLLINIAGFIPLGFFFFLYFSSVRHLGRAGVVTVLLGAAASLTIEVLQSFLPTRNSGTTDLFTNTLGTYLGVVLCRWKPTLIEQTLARLPF
jgi:VanZ family protein